MLGVEASTADSSSVVGNAVGDDDTSVVLSVVVVAGSLREIGAELEDGRADTDLDLAGLYDDGRDGAATDIERRAGVAVVVVDSSS